MKKLFVLLSLVTALSFQKSQAQVSVNINIGAQPVWGPVGYNHVDYYYLPDIEAYYYVPTRQFIYLNAGSWVFAASLPARYHGYDLYRGYKVVINEPKPYLHHNDYRVRYANYSQHAAQPTIRYSNNPKYYEVKGHPNYNNRPSRYERSTNVKGRNNKGKDPGSPREDNRKPRNNGHSDRSRNHR